MSMVVRRLGVACLAGLGMVSITYAVGSSSGRVAAAGPSGGACQLQGQATISPGLNASSQAFTYSFAGNLASCQSNVAGAPTQGTVGAGNVVPENVTVTTAGGPVAATFNYQEPVAKGTGSCGNSTTSGEAFAVWNDNTQTAINYTTTGAAAAVTLQGTADASFVLQPVPGQGITVAGVFYPAPTYTFTTTRYAGQSALATLAFQPPDPTACNTSAGVTKAGISGTVGLGTAQ
jgi:hypothetical protein